MLDDGLKRGFYYALFRAEIRIGEWLCFLQVVHDIIERAACVEFVALVAGAGLCCSGLHVAVIPTIHEVAGLAGLAVQLWQEATAVECEWFSAGASYLAECRQEVAEVD